MVLPEVLEERYEQFLEEVKREQNTPYLSVLERKALREGWEQGVQKGLQEGHEKGLQEGLQEGILTLLRTLYGEVPAELVAQVRAIHDVETLNALYPLAVSAGSLESFAQQLAQQQGD
jgi:flagellar biosynthesis/type III secretory pathway protein FliH